MRYKAFISYSHAADGKLAPALQSGLHRFAKPWYKLRALRIFRDQTNLSISPHLWSQIETALNDAEYFFLLASPKSKSSKWVRQEVDFWLKKFQAEKLLIILTEGDLVWDDARHDFDWHKTTAIPAELQNRFPEEPLFLDFRWARTTEDLSLQNPKFRDAIADLGATLHGRPKDELVGEDVRQHQRTRRLAWSAVCLLIGLTLAACMAAYLAIRNAREARRQQNLAVSRQLAAQSSLVLKDNPGQIDRSLLLAIESMRRAPSFDGDAALRLGLKLFLKPLKIPGVDRLDLAVFGPESRFLVAANADNAVRIFDLPDDKERLRLPHPDSVIRLAVSHDGRYLATACADGLLRIFSVDTGTLVKQLRSGGHTFGLDFSPDGKFLAIGGDDKLVRVLDSTEWIQILTLKHDDAVGEVSYSPDGRYLVTRSSGWRMFDAATGKDVSRLADEDHFEAIAAGTNGKYVALGFGNRPEFYDAKTGKQLGGWPGQIVSAVAFSPDGTSFVTCGGMAGIDKACRLFRPSSPPEQFLVLPAQQDVVGAISYSSDSRYLATVDVKRAGGTIRVFDTTNGTEVGDIPPRGSGSAVVFSPGSRYLVTGAGTDARIYELSSDLTLRIPSHGKVHEMTLSAGGEFVAHAGQVQVFDVANRRQILPATDLGTGPGVALSPEGGYLAVVNLRRPLAVVKLASGDEVFRDEQVEDKIQRVVLNASVALSANGQRLARSTGGGVSVLELPSRKLIFQVQGVGRVRSVSITPDGRYLGVGSEKRVGYVYDLQNGTDILEVKHQSIVHAVALSPDGRYFASGSLDKTVPIYDVATRKLVRNLSHQQSVFAIAFSADDRFVATGGLDSTARVFDLATGAEVTRVSQPDPIRAIAFSPDGQHLTTIAGDKGDVLVSRFFLRPEELIDEACSRLTRNLTPEEWKQYIGVEESYRKTCPSVP